MWFIGARRMGSGRSAALEEKRMAARLEGSGLTRFQIRVLLEVMRIPRGETRTYSEVARMAGSPRAYRAVGTAVRRNPFAPRIPCHRVVRSDGSIGRYSGRGGAKAKMLMLKSEGAVG